MFLLPSPLLLLLLSPLLLSLLLFPSPVLSQTFFTQECGNSVNSVYSTSCVGATGTNAHAAWSPRSNAFVFEYSGAIWIAGGEGSTTTPATTLTIAPLNDVWGSYDLGRSWIQATGTVGAGGNGCTSSTGHAAILGLNVFLFCTGYNVAATNVRVHGSINPLVNQYTYSSSSPTLASFTSVSSAGVSDGLESRVDFSINVLAAPFDGVGVAVALGGYDPTSLTSPYHNDVWTFSPSGSFPPGATASRWYLNTALAPWSPRSSQSTTTDGERLVLIMTGGVDATINYNDVWQMSFDTGTATTPAAILWYRLTPTPGYAPRRNAAFYTVNDWLFLYGGAQGTSQLVTADYDDVWMSADYGSTWTQWPQTGTGTGRYGVAGYSEARRLFVLGGAESDNVVGLSFSNQVYVGYW